MTNNDLKQIGALINEKLSSTEKRLREDLRALRKDMLASDEQVTNNIGDFIEKTLMPMINERFDAIDEKFDEKADKTDIDRIERKLDRILDTNFDHERRITDIESVSVVTHELKHRKSK